MGIGTSGSFGVDLDTENAPYWSAYVRAWLDEQNFSAEEVSCLIGMLSEQVTEVPKRLMSLRPPLIELAVFPGKWDDAPSEMTRASFRLESAFGRKVANILAERKSS